MFLSMNVDFSDKTLLKTTIKSFLARYLKHVKCLIQYRAIGQRIWFSYVRVFI